MIDITSETLFPLAEACSRLPRRRGGRPVHAATVYRWAKQGLRGVRLETVQVGGTRCTSVEALGRFFGALAHHAEVKVLAARSVEPPEERP